MGLIRRLCVEEAAGTELSKKLTESLKEILSENKVRANTIPAIDMKCCMLDLLVKRQITNSLKHSSYRHEQKDFC